MTTDVALAKLATIERCLERIRSVTAGDPDAVDDLDTEELVVLNLQRATQAASTWRHTPSQGETGAFRRR